jgi:flagellin-like hook-associated protein FlgL
MAGWGTIYNNSIWSMKNRMAQIAKLQLQVTSGNRVNVASDNPGDSFRIISLQNQENNYNTYLENIATVTFNLEQASSNLQMTTDSLAGVQQLLTQAASGTYNESNRIAAGESVDQTIEGLMTLVNGNTMGRYLFGGVNMQEPPFEVTRDSDGRISAVTYTGSSEEMLVPVAPGVNLPGALVGTDVFRADSRQSPDFAGATGAMAGNGTSSVRGDVTLEIRHTATTYGGATGGAAVGSHASWGDSILGTHTIDITAANNTITLDGGPVVDFSGMTPAELANVRVTNDDGACVYVDLTGWGGADASFTATGDGEMSIDGGASTTPVTFTANDAVTDATTGKTLFVNTTNLRQSGTEAVRVGGTYDLFETLIDIRDTLLNTGGLSRQAQSSRLDNLIGSLEEVFDGVNESMTAVGGRIQALNDLNDNLESLRFSSEEQRTSLQQADVAQVATDIARTMTFYEMTLQSTSKLLNLSLLNFIR